MASCSTEVFMKVAIPAAGRGSRFAAEHLTVPKELLPLGGIPVLGHALMESARAGFDSAVVVIAPSKEQIRRYLAEVASPLPVEVVEQPEPLGIGDAVLRCWAGEPLGVLLPDDVVLETAHWKRLTEAHKKDGAAALCVRPVAREHVGRFGIVECDGDRVTALFEKPRPDATSSDLAILGRYIVTGPVIRGLQRSRSGAELELTFGLEAAVESPPGVRAVRFEGEIYDCGTPSEYARALSRFPAP
jgi:UTP--glucose-1-phosphate uridylyltransferase